MGWSVDKVAKKAPSRQQLLPYLATLANSNPSTVMNISHSSPVIIIWAKSSLPADNWEVAGNVPERFILYDWDCIKTFSIVPKICISQTLIILLVSVFRATGFDKRNSLGYEEELALSPLSEWKVQTKPKSYSTAKNDNKKTTRILRKPLKVFVQCP